MKRICETAIVAMVCAAFAVTGCNGCVPTSETATKGWQGASMSSDPEALANGRRIATEQCASCHAIDRTAPSPRPDAPPLRNVLAVYDTDNLAYRFVEGMKVGHDDMPLFDFDIHTADDLLAYIASISGP